MKAFRAMLPLFVSLAVLALVGAQEQTATQQANFSTIPPLTYNATGNNVILRDVLVRGRIWENCPGVQGNQTGGNQTSAAQAGADQLGLLDSANLVPKTQFAARVREFNISQMQFSFVVQPDCPGEQAQNQQNVSEVVNMWPANFDSATFVNSSILVDMIQPCSQSQNQTGGQQSQNWGGVSVSIQQFQASNLTARILLTKTCNGAGQVQGNQTGGNATTPSQADQGQGNLTQSQQVSPANGTFQSGNQTWAFTIQDVSLQSFNATVEVSSNNCTQLWQQTVGSDSAPFPPGQAYNQSSQNPFFQDIIVRAQFGRLASSCSSNLTQSNETAPGDVNQVPMALPTVQVLNSLNATAFNMTVQQVYAAISLFCSGGNQTSNQTNTTQADQSQNMQMYGPLVFTATNLTADGVHAQVNVSDVCPSQNVQSGNSSQAMQDQASFVRGSWLNRIRRMLG